MDEGEVSKEDDQGSCQAGGEAGGSRSRPKSKQLGLFPRPCRTQPATAKAEVILTSAIVSAVVGLGRGKAIVDRCRREEGGREGREGRLVEDRGQRCEIDLILT